MKKIWKLTLLWALALCLLAGCGSVQGQPERPPLQQEGQEVQTPPESTGQQETPDDPVIVPGESQAAAPDTQEEPVQPVTPEVPDAPVQPEQPGTTDAPSVPVEPQQPDSQEEPPAPVPPEEQETGDQELTCTLEIRCDTILNNTDLLDPDKAELVPQDGVLFTASEVVFYEGESVFQVLQRTLKQNKQHLEFAQSPLYNSAYIEGICNLYQFDCGALSGWMYRVNEWYPNYGCSQYVVQEGDVIVWDFTCDLGADLGAENIGNNQ